MSNGFQKHAPWWAHWVSGLVAQAGLAGAQILSYKLDGGTAMVLGLAICQGIVGVAMVFGPAAAGALAGRVGTAVHTAKAQSHGEEPV